MNESNKISYEIIAKDKQSSKYEIPIKCSKFIQSETYNIFKTRNPNKPLKKGFKELYELNKEGLKILFYFYHELVNADRQVFIEILNQINLERKQIASPTLIQIIKKTSRA